MSGTTREEKLKQLEQTISEVTSDFYRYCQVNLKIRTKSGEVVPLTLNSIQKQIADKVIDDLVNNRPVRYIILKARQEGVSTVIEALIYWWTSTHFNIKSKIVAHENETAKELYEMFRRYYDNTDPMFKPKIKYNTRSDLTFDNDEGTGLKSQIDVASAKNTGVGRGQTINWLHGSEVSLWSDGNEIVAGLMQAVPLLPKTAIFIESTANGIGDYFHSTWQAAKVGKSVFKPLFFSWADMEEYAITPPDNFALTDEETVLKQEYNLSDAQINWRREKMKEFPDDPDRFKQEYPLNDVEAFLASGRARFHIPSLLAMEEAVKEPKRGELLDNTDLEANQNKAYKFYETPNGPLKLWQEPQENKRYVIGADVSEGIGGDLSVATIMDEETTETVARWVGEAEPSEFGEILFELGAHYNDALIACEINNHGLTTVQRLRDLNYGNLYRREKGIEERFEEYTSLLGWKTDRKTKPLMINALAEAILKQQLKDYDIDFIRECMSYVIDDRGRTNAQQGKHDDTVIATAIALQVFDWTDVAVKRRTVASKIPERYMKIKRMHQQLAKKRNSVYY